MATHQDPVIEAALQTLAGERHDRSRAADLVPDQPGLYAFYGEKQPWTELALEPAFDGQPLYVGKAERSLNGRDVRTHFATGKTGSSTVRRSLAALLIDDVGLVAVPRNLAKPDGSANYALDPPSDARLSTWMENHLRLATWVRPDGLVLGDIEIAVVLRLRPPLNLDKVGEPRERLRRARRRLADQARAWNRIAKPPPA
jgi:hypothetical protein